MRGRLSADACRFRVWLSQFAKFGALVLIIFSFALASIVSCDNEEKTSCPESWRVTNIARTDNEGNLLEDDPEDWQPRCEGRHGVGESTYLCSSPAYPNPTSEGCTIPYGVGIAGKFTLTILDRRCREIRSIVDQAKLGYNFIVWDLKDDKGNAVQPGIYRARIVTVVDEEIVETWGDIQVVR